MKRKNIVQTCFVIVLILFSVSSVFAQQVPKASGAIASTLRGMNIVVGNWWHSYDPKVTPPTNSGPEVNPRKNNLITAKDFYNNTTLQ